MKRQLVFAVLAVAMLFLLAGCSAISSGSSHESAQEWVNWQSDGTYLVDESRLDSTVQLLGDLFGKKRIVSAADMPPKMIKHYTELCQKAYGLQAGYAAEIHREDRANFMCFKMHFREPGSIEAVCTWLKMKPVWRLHKGWQFGCAPDRI